MPITIRVRSGAKASSDAPALTFDGDRIVLGRGDGADVRLPDTSVSTRHASIRSAGSDYVLLDEGSTNGTFVGGIRLSPRTPRALRTGDLVRMGRVWVEVVIGQAAPMYDLALATRDIALALVAHAMNEAGSDVVPRLSVVEGPDVGAEMRLVDDGRVYLIGRAETCDLPLADPDASREHVQIVRRGNQVLVRDLSSRNGVFLGEAHLPPQRDIPWKGNTMMRVSASVLALEEPVAAALAELEIADDEPFAEEPPPPGAPAEAPAEATAPESQSAPDSVLAAGDAPIAMVAFAPTAALPARRKRGWSMTDVLVVVLALGVIGASTAGLVWLLRG